jgi:Ulp1 family protease
MLAKLVVGQTVVSQILFILFGHPVCRSTCRSIPPSVEQSSSFHFTSPQPFKSSQASLTRHLEIFSPKMSPKSSPLIACRRQLHQDRKPRNNLIKLPSYSSNSSSALRLAMHAEKSDYENQFSNLHFHLSPSFQNASERDERRIVFENTTAK